MPDWLTHVAIGLLFAELFSVRKKSIVLLGAILPDILPKIILLQLLFPLPVFNNNILEAAHVPFIFFLGTMMVAPLFRYNYWKIVGWLNLGAVSHFLADALLRHFGGGGVRLLYPLASQKYTLNLVWQDQTYLIFTPVLLLYLMVQWYKKSRFRNVFKECWRGEKKT